MPFASTHLQSPSVIDSYVSCLHFTQCLFLEVCYENALYKFTFGIDIDIDIGHYYHNTAVGFLIFI